MPFFLLPRGNVQELGYYFDGTGYGKVKIYIRNTVINFFVLSRQMDAIIFYMENQVNRKKCNIIKFKFRST